MSFRDKQIKIECWSSNTLFLGDYDSPEVNEVLEANRCKCYHNEPTDKNGQDAECKECDNTGYKGDFEVSWLDESDKENCNVYDYIDY